MPTKTQCVLIGKEQDRKPTAAFIRTEVLSSFFPLLTVRGDAKLGFKFKISLKVNVRLLIYPESSPGVYIKIGANNKLVFETMKMGVSFSFGN